MERFQIKTWRLDNLDGITDADLSWLRKHCHNVQVTGGADPITINYMGRQFNAAVREIPFCVKFTTNSSKEETIVQLKFGDKIFLESWVNCTTASWPA